MPDKKYVVALVEHSTVPAPAPTLADLATLMGEVRNFWWASTYGYFNITFDCIGPVPLDAPTQGADEDVKDFAKRIKTAAFNTVRHTRPEVNSRNDGVLNVIVTPNRFRSSAELGSDDGYVYFGSSFQTFCHELGHMLGFDHSYGVIRAVDDWDGDGDDELVPTYGDPFDVMAGGWDGADGTLAPAIPSFPGIQNRAGPLLSRAQLHYRFPAAIDNRVAHVVFGEDTRPVLTPAGEERGIELVAFHPKGEGIDGLGRIYVELRGPTTTGLASEWDRGFAVEGLVEERRGVVVHTIGRRNGGQGESSVWYSGHIAFPGADADTKVAASGGVEINVSDEGATGQSPRAVRVWLKEPRDKAFVRILESEDRRVQVLKRLQRKIPNWEWAGFFTWEIRQTLLTATYRPVVRGMGQRNIGHDQEVAVTWSLNGQQLRDGVTQTLLLPGLGKRDRVEFSTFRLDDDYRLQVTNHPEDGAVHAKVGLMAYDGRHVSAPDAIFEAEGRTEGWGQDYQDYMDLWRRITNPIPKRKFGIGPVPERGWPPKESISDLRDGLWRALDRVSDHHPEAAERLREIVTRTDRKLRSIAQ